MDQRSLFGYTGQIWLSDFEVYSYKARIYSPRLGRFMQTDPIGYADGLNWYAYTGNDPVNKIDPWGMEIVCAPWGCEDVIVVRGDRCAASFCLSADGARIVFERFEAGYWEFLAEFDRAFAKPVRDEAAKCGGEKGARAPDFYSVAMAGGLSKLLKKLKAPEKLASRAGFEASATVDRFGRVYFTGGFSGNKSPVDGVSLSATGNYLLSSNTPYPEDLAGFIQGGPTVNLAAGTGPGATASANLSGASVGSGIVVGASASVSGTTKPKKLIASECPGA